MSIRFGYHTFPVLFRALSPKLTDVIISYPHFQRCGMLISAFQQRSHDPVIISPRGKPKCKIRQLWVLITKSPWYDPSGTNAHNALNAVQWFSVRLSKTGHPPTSNQPTTIPPPKSKEITDWAQLHKNKWFLGVNAEDSSGRVKGFSNFNYMAA